jgi:asparagine synthase (glutamine-hydrolysing)
MQDFLAVKELKDQGKISENSVFVPGHAADMFSGSHLSKDYIDSSNKYNSEIFLIACMNKYYNLWKWPHGSQLEHIFKEKISKTESESKLEIKDNDGCVNAIEFFEFNERQPKLIVNSIRVYEFFGYEWRMPLLDTELIDFFLKVPVKHRINKALYKKYARDLLFSGELSTLKEIDCTTDMLDLRPVEERSKYEKLLYYRTFIHSYYDESIDNPFWGRYFKHPLYTSKILTKVLNYENEAIEGYPLLKMILAYRNREKYPLSLNGISSLEYLAKINEETYSSAHRGVLQPSVFITKKRSVAKNYKIDTMK